MIRKLWIRKANFLLLSYEIFPMYSSLVTLWATMEDKYTKHQLSQLCNYLPTWAHCCSVQSPAWLDPPHLSCCHNGSHLSAQLHPGLGQWAVSFPGRLISWVDYTSDGDPVSCSIGCSKHSNCMHGAEQSSLHFWTISHGFCNLQGVW